MENVQDILGKANYVYHKSEDPEELRAGETELEKLLSYDWLNQKNRESAEALCWRIRAKELALAYFTCGYNADDFEKLGAFLAEKTPLAREKGYANTAELFVRLADFSAAVQKIMADAAAQALRVRTYDWKAATSSREECIAVADAFAAKEEQAVCLRSGQEVFGKDVVFPPVADELVQDLHKVQKFARDLAENIRLKDDEGFLTENARELRGSTEWARFEFFPELSKGGQYLANALVLCTPFSEEAELFAVKNAPAEVYSVPAGAFEGRMEESLDNIFSIFAKKNVSVIVCGAERYRGGNKQALFRAAARFGKGGHKIFFIDPTGDRQVYEQALSACAGGGLSAIDVSFLYLSMPNYREVIELFEEKGMIDSAQGDYAFVKERMPFMGFVGLNLAVKAFARKKEWKQLLTEFSSERRSAAFRYLRKLPSQGQLLDDGWGDYSSEVDSKLGGKREFSYDDIGDVNPNNIRKIMTSGLSLFEKCGLLARYCSACGNDQSVWAKLDNETKSERLTAATRLIMRALGIGIDPEVQVLDELKNKGAGGTCCDGGKLILYKKSSVQDYEWTVGAICHECFHAFQAMAVRGGWADWYWEELGVTKARITQWGLNELCYFNIPHKAYRVQIYEADAFAFESDCVKKSNDVWHTIDFE